MDKKMTPEEHQERHKELHKVLDELVADWITDTGGLPSTGSVFELMQWSYGQTIEPSTREDPAPLEDVVPDAPPPFPEWEREPVVCDGCNENNGPDSSISQAEVVPVWAGEWVCPGCNKLLGLGGLEAGKPKRGEPGFVDCGIGMRSKPERQVMSRGINPSIPQRQKMVEVTCPACQVTIDTVPAKTLICPNLACRTLFEMESGRILELGGSRAR